MNIVTLETRFADYIEKHVILKFFTGIERYKILFFMPFKLKELENKIIGSIDLLKQLGFINCNDEVDIEKLRCHAVDTAKKCGSIEMVIESKTITINPDDIDDFFKSLY